VPKRSEKEEKEEKEKGKKKKGRRDTEKISPSNFEEAPII
jgi:hypothetical protein